MRVGRLNNGKAAGKDELTRKMIKRGVGRGLDWIWILYNKAFECGVVPDDWRSAVIVPLYKGKEEKTEYKNYRCISFLSVVVKIYARILVDRVCRVTGG